MKIQFKLFEWRVNWSVDNTHCKITRTFMNRLGGYYNNMILIRFESFMKARPNHNSNYELIKICLEAAISTKKKILDKAQTPII